MNIININTQIISAENNNVTNTSFLSDDSLLDAELIFWDISKSYEYLPGSSGLNINNNYHKLAKEYKKLIAIRKNEFEEFFNIGRTLIITSPDFRIYEYKSTINHDKVTLDFIDSLEINKPIVEPKKGSNMEPLDEEHIKTFYSKSKQNLKFNFKIKKSIGNPLLYIKDTKHVVGEYYKIRNGIIIILPSIQIHSNAEQEKMKLINSLVELSENLKKKKINGKYEIPIWVNSYQFKEEEIENEKLLKAKAKLDKIKAEIKQRKLVLSNYNFLKALFASDGETLENAVEFTLKEIGFNIEKHDENNRTDLIIKSNLKVAVFEVKGLTKSAKEQNAAQLEKWVSSYHVKNGVEPKGILVVNTYKKLRLEERTEVDFPKQMLTYVKRKEQSIITGLQLLCIYLDFKTKKINKKDIESLLFNTIGEIIYKDDPMKLIQNSEEKTT